MSNPDKYLHAFKTFLGLPPSKEDAPACGATLTDAYDFAGAGRPLCPECDRLLKEANVPPFKEENVPPCDVVEGCPNPSVDVVGGEVWYCAEHEGGAYDAYIEWHNSPERAARVADQGGDDA